MFPWRSVPWILKRLSDQILGVEDEGESAPWPWRMKPELCTHVFQKAYAVPYYKIQGFEKMPSEGLAQAAKLGGQQLLSKSLAEASGAAAR